MKLYTDLTFILNYTEIFFVNFLTFCHSKNKQKTRGINIYFAEFSGDDSEEEDSFTVYKQCV